MRGVPALEDACSFSGRDDATARPATAAVSVAPSADSNALRRRYSSDGTHVDHIGKGSDSAGGTNFIRSRSGSMTARPQFRKTFASSGKGAASDAPPGEADSVINTRDGREFSGNVEKNVIKAFLQRTGSGLIISDRSLSYGKLENDSEGDSESGGSGGGDGWNDVLSSNTGTMDTPASPLLGSRRANRSASRHGDENDDEEGFGGAEGSDQDSHRSEARDTFSWDDVGETDAKSERQKRSGNAKSTVGARTHTTYSGRGGGGGGGGTYGTTTSANMGSETDGRQNASQQSFGLSAARCN